MTTFADLQNEVLLALEGFTNDQAAVAVLAGGGVTDTATSLTVTGGAFSDGSGLSTGVWEVEEEMVFVPDFNRTTGVATNVIRGWRGSTAVAHSAGVAVRNNPKFPVVQVKRAINDSLRNLFPRVPAIKTADLTLQTRKTRYQLPSDAKGVVSVQLQDGTSEDDAWRDLRVWKFNPKPGASLNGYTSIELPYEGRNDTVRVVYTAEPSPLTATSDNFETVSGLPAFAREAVVWGAVWRLYSFSELGRGFFSAADQTMMNRQPDFGKATDIAKYILGMHQQAVTDAESRMQDLYPPVRHYVWG